MRRKLRDWQIELILLALLAVAAFLLLEQWDIRGTLWRWLDTALVVSTQVFNTTLRRVIPNTVSDLIGLMLIVTVLILARWRARWRLMHSPSLASRICPRCDSQLRRIHRKPLDRAINRLLAPVHRYMCSNRECRWTGLRVDSPKPKHGADSISETQG
jgi:hypothetical protein